jgi:hypothetical protein
MRSAARRATARAAKLRTTRRSTAGRRTRRWRPPSGAGRSRAEPARPVAQRRHPHPGAPEPGRRDAVDHGPGLPEALLWAGGGRNPRRRWRHGAQLRVVVRSENEATCGSTRRRRRQASRLREMARARQAEPRVSVLPPRLAPDPTSSRRRPERRRRARRCRERRALSLGGSPPAAGPGIRRLSRPGRRDRPSRRGSRARSRRRRAWPAGGPCSPGGRPRPPGRPGTPPRCRGCAGGPRAA